MDHAASKAELVDFVGDSYDKLNMIWSEYGFPLATLEKRNKAVLNHTKELFDDMLTEEQKRLVEKKEERNGYQESVNKLCRDLQLPMDEIPRLSSTTLIQQCEELLVQETQLKEKKAEKMKKWIQLKQEEKALKELLGETFVGDVADYDGIPGSAEIDSLKVVLSELAQEKIHRGKEYGKLKPRIKDLLKLLEKTELNQLERKITDDGDTPLLSLDFLAKCRDVENQLRAQVDSNRNESERLRKEIEELKRRLKDDPAVQGIPVPNAFTPTALTQIRAEHDRLTQLKMLNLGNFITKVRAEIQELSELVFRKPLMPEVAEPTEQSLDFHEHLLQNLKAYQVEHKKLLESWRKRQTLWSQWLEYEAKADDPNRFNNRGGALLREEKQRKTLEKNLPKLESEITSLAETCPAFKIFDRDVKDIISEDWDGFNREKEEKKMLKKQQTGTNNTMNVTRKRPMTPGAGTPAGKRGKMMPNAVATPSTAPKPPATPKRALRSSTSKDNLPSPTYSEFTSHKHIFQSTMTEQGNKIPLNPKSPGRNGNAAVTRMTPREIKDKF